MLLHPQFTRGHKFKIKSSNIIGVLIQNGTCQFIRTTEYMFISSVKLGSITM